MRTQQRIAVVVGAWLWLAVAAAWAQQPVTMDSLAKLVERQGQLLAEQARQIEALKTQVQELQTRSAAAATVVQGLSAVTDDVATVNRKLDRKFSLGKHIEGLKLNGDLRLRHEWRDRLREVANPDNDDRQRSVVRFRAGAVWSSPTEGWEVGAGLATGGADGRSTNDTWGDDHLFETGDIRLDYAYARHTWTLDALGGKPLSLTLGQQPNPFLVTPLTWDDDLRPTGLTAQFGDPAKKDYAGPFVTLGAYELYNGSNMGSPDAWENADILLFGAQLGYRMTAPIDLKVALAYRHVTGNFDDIRDQANAWKFSDANGNGRYDAPETLNDLNGNGTWNAGEAYTDTNGNGKWDKNDGYLTNSYDAPADTSSAGLWHADQSEDFDVIDLLVDGRFTVAGVGLRPYGNIAYNLGADGTKSQQTIVRGYNRVTNPEAPDENNLGWMLGLEATYGKLKLGYAYVYVEADAVFGPMRDNESGATPGLTDTDVQGHKLGATWSFTPNFSLSANAFILERIEGGSEEVGGTDYDHGATYQLEALYKF